MIPFNLLAQQCAPMVSPQTMAAIVKVESGGDPLAMWDNTARRQYRPATVAQAQQILAALMAAGHKVDVGIGQVDTENFAAYGLNLSNVFNACTNLHAAGEILQSNYQKAALVYGPGQLALYHAFEGYNSGRLIGDSSYANKVLYAAGLPVVIGPDGGLHYAVRKHPVNPFPMLGWPGINTVSWKIG